MRTPEQFSATVPGLFKTQLSHNHFRTTSFPRTSERHLHGQLCATFFSELTYWSELNMEL